MEKSTIVTNVLTRETTTFFNDLSLIDNVISTIILSDGAGNHLTDEAFRTQLKNKLALKESVSFTRLKHRFVFCNEYDLYATHN